MGDKSDPHPHVVASMIAGVISNAQSTKGELVKLALADFVGIADEDRGAYGPVWSEKLW